MRRNGKYNARPTDCGFGHQHASKKEAKRCGELTLMQKAGEITGLCQQPEFVLMVANSDGGGWIPVGKYRADFEYLDKSERRVIEDCKGVRTPIFILKKKLMKAIYGIEVLET